MEWLKFAEQYGISSAGLAAIFWYVVLPLKDRHIKFLDTTEETNKSLAKTIEKQAEILEGVQTGLDRMNSKIDKMEEVVEKLSVVTQHLRMP
jgi:methyl-accepting chemotaxis protein